MAETIQNFIVNTFGDHVVLATIIVALLPIFELRGAIPFATSISIFGKNALSPILSLLVGFLSTCLIIPIVYFLFKPVLNAFKQNRLFKKLATAFENKINNKSENINNKSLNNTSNKTKSNLYKMLAICGFVAVPLPLTGSYTGTAIAVMLGLNFKQTFVACSLGNFIAGSIITILCSLSSNAGTYILIAFCCILLISILLSLFKHLLKIKKRV